MSRETTHKNQSCTKTSEFQLGKEDAQGGVLISGGLRKETRRTREKGNPLGKVRIGLIIPKVRPTGESQVSRIILGEGDRPSVL